MLLVLAEQRKQREIDPTMELLKQCAIEAEQDEQTSEYVTRQFQSMSSFMQTMDVWYRQMRTMDRKLLERFFKLGSKLVFWLGKK
ncbi:hypothetical protein A9Q98_15940 [Thalassotalea sp. 42_200_T64]|nr:hypothetical protein A9Q98_15940 [Thalassotalea sp. 42_200_T64]